MMISSRLKLASDQTTQSGTATTSFRGSTLTHVSEMNAFLMKTSMFSSDPARVSQSDIQVIATLLDAKESMNNNNNTAYISTFFDVIEGTAGLSVTARLKTLTCIHKLILLLNFGDILLNKRIS